VATRAASALPERMFDQRTPDDEAHLVVQAPKTAKGVEHAVAPQEVVGGGRKLVTIGAEFQPLFRTMILQIARDDAILHHPAERDAVAAGRPCELSGQREVCLASQGSAVVRIRTRLTAISRNGRAMPNTRRVSCRIQSVASA
jgi:hypothetical protein